MGGVKCTEPFEAHAFRINFRGSASPGDIWWMRRAASFCPGGSTSRASPRRVSQKVLTRHATCLRFHLFPSCAPFVWLVRFRSLLCAKIWNLRVVSLPTPETIHLGICLAEIPQVVVFALVSLLKRLHPQGPPNSAKRELLVGRSRICSHRPYLFQQCPRLRLPGNGARKVCIGKLLSIQYHGCLHRVHLNGQNTLIMSRA